MGEDVDSTTEPKCSVDLTRASLGLSHFKKLLVLLTALMRIDEPHLLAHFAWAKTGCFEMTEVMANLVIKKCFLKSEMRISHNGFLRMCYSFELIDPEEKQGLSYGRLGLLFVTTLQRMPQLLTAREQRRRPYRSDVRRSLRPPAEGKLDEKPPPAKEIVGRSELSVLLEELHA